MTIWARKIVDAEFTIEELELIIDASLNNNRVSEAIKLLRDKYGGEGYMSGEEISYQVYIYDKEKYIRSKFRDIEW